MTEYDPNYVETKNFYLLGVKAAIINNKNEVLLLQRSEKSSRPGGWDLPGGSVDANESPEQATIRETFEETGIEITAAKTVASGLIPAEDPIVILGFGATVEDPEVTLSWEHQSYEWVPVDELSETELPGPYQQIVYEYVG